MLETTPAIAFRMNGVLVAITGAAPGQIIAVEQLAITPRQRHAQQIPSTRHRRAIEHAQYRLAIQRCAPQESKYAVGVVAQIHPLKAFPGVIGGMEFGSLTIDEVHGLAPFTQGMMVGMLKQRPVQHFAFAPFMPLTKLAAHE